MPPECVSQPGDSKRGNSLCAASERWVRWGSIVTHRPWTALLVAGIPLLILAFQARKISPGVPDHDSLPAAAESVQALHTLQSMGRSGIVQSLRVVLELPPQYPLLSPAGWLAVNRFTKRFQSDPRAEEVLSLPTLTECPTLRMLSTICPSQSARAFFAAMAKLP